MEILIGMRESELFKLLDELQSAKRAGESSRIVGLTPDDSEAEVNIQIYVESSEKIKAVHNVFTNGD
jgi:hypothetical protein